MKIFILFFLIASTALAVNKKEKVVDSERVWTFTFYEYGLLRDEQKDEFVKLFLEESKNNPVLNNVIENFSQLSVKSTLKSSAKWELIEFKINKACQEKKNLNSCDKIAALRRAVLEKYRAHR